MKTQPDFAELSAAAQGRVDDVCDAFEVAWQAVTTDAGSDWPVIETFVERLNSGERVAALCELVPIDVSYRRRGGAPASIAEYARFEELDADWLAAIVLNPEGATRRVAPSSDSRPESVPRPKPAPPTFDVFVERLVSSSVLDRETVDREITSLVESPRTAVSLGERLVSRGLLTPFQFSSLLRTQKPGLVLGEYIILSPLGRGGMGAVYRARHRRMDRIVAIKVLPPSAALDPQAASRFSREIRAVARLSHPNIVAAHDAGEDSGVAYLVMECIDGIDLSTCVRTHGPLSVAHAVECIAQAAEGLEYAHQQGIIHRDIKPSNLILCHDRASASGATGEGLRSPVLLENTGGPKQPPVAPERESMTTVRHDDSPHAIPPSALRIKVLDLGLARFQAEVPTSHEASPVITRSGMMFGTPEYMSPEQAVNASTADQRSDIYSLGCTLYFLLTGRPVLAGQTFLETVMAHQLQSLPSLAASRADVPAELEQIFRRMTARNAEQRYASMRDVREALRAIPDDRLSRVPSAAVLKPLATEHASQHAGSTEWFAPLQAAVEGKDATVLMTNFDAPSKDRKRLSPRSRFVEWSKQNRPLSVAMAAVIGCLLIAGGVWWWTQPGDQTSNTGKSNASSPTASLPKVPRPQPLSCPADTALVQQRQREWAEYLGTEPTIKNNIGMTLCLIPPGEFTMGTSDAEFNAHPEWNVPQYEITRMRNELPAHRVQLTNAFWIGQTEVTVSQFRRFVDAEHYVTETEKTEGYGVENNRWILRQGFSWQNVGEATVEGNHPASNITWNDAVAFCDWLSRHDSRESGQAVRYRLPTEAEWEFACRAGTDTPWYFGSDMAAVSSYGIFAGNSAGRLQPVGRKLENSFRLFDVSGNQAEWCQDWFAPYGGIDAINPTGPLSGQERVQRGGNFGDQPPKLRSASRQSRTPSSPQHGSLRVVREE
ncbi:MAG: SUMF1/EgtB/PvdO family nonheme iron enzyme [Planctomycetota bacterium]